MGNWRSKKSTSTSFLLALHVRELGNNNFETVLSFPHQGSYLFIHLFIYSFIYSLVYFRSLQMFIFIHFHAYFIWFFTKKNDNDVKEQKLMIVILIVVVFFVFFIKKNCFCLFCFCCGMMKVTTKWILRWLGTTWPAVPSRYIAIVIIKWNYQLFVSCWNRMIQSCGLTARYWQRSFVIDC